MGTIGSALGSYYQLANLLSSGSGSSNAFSTATSSPSGVETLAQALDAIGSSGSGSGSSYLLDLSPQAQQLMSGNTGGGSAGGTSGGFSLTSAQQTAIKNIIEKYKDAPVDQATFNAIQNALQAAGLSPQTLAAEDQVNSFNATNVLIGALNGDYSNVQTPTATASGEQTKESNYMQSIVSLWKSDSTASSASGSAAPVSVSA